MIRVLVLVLLAGNLLYFGWSRWVSEEQPQLVAPADGTASPGTQPIVPTACATIGPVPDETQALEIEQLLRDLQLGPSRRTVTEQVHEGWWVYVATADAAAQARTLRAIQRAGIQDASAMPEDATFRVSVGIFREQAGATSRAETVRALQLDAVVEERFQPQVAVWFDLPGTPSHSMNLNRIGAEGVQIESLRVEDCPEGADVDLDSIMAPAPDAEPAAAEPAAVPQV